MSSKKMKTGAGFSVMEVLSSVAIFSFLLLASASFFSQMNQSILKQRYTTSRVRLIHGLIHIMGMPATLRASGAASPTSVLGKCINHFQNALCSGLSIAAPEGVALYLPPITGTTIANLSGPLSGTPAAPLFFSPEGKVCNPNLESCSPELFPIAVSTRALPICPPSYSVVANPNWSQPVYPAGLAPMSDCWQSQYIKIFYDIRPAAGAPEALVFAPVNGTIMVSSVMAGLSL
jgi:hypothetical protein